MKITECRNKDLPLLKKHLPAIAVKHEERFGIQNNNEGLYLIAWADSKPVGLIEIIFDGKGIKGSTNFIENCPDLKYLLVSESRRGKGIGELLVREASTKLISLRYKKLGLLVDKGNVPARNLYSKLGFRDSGLGDFPGINKSIIDGKEVHKKEVANYWVKEL